ncbi:hypothetical protein I6N96_07150 [Enterococcus sp. BWM-S5]|uniref:Uncharacterized protein n=1 Tax=Enterococcus larvae TaxID=2794352 RepID=A0ABS4CHZ4_9ENTE|nr:hypothetical protein [Enterococcus larvae]MBP1046055.1 hypothetical protein [Enterococcus larvae]
MGLVQDFSLSAIEEYFNKHGQSIAMSFYNASAKNVGTEIGSALHIGGTVSKNLGKTMPLIGAVIDFGTQVYDGENLIDATNKTVLHAVSGVIVGAAVTAVLPATASIVAVIGAGVVVGFVVNTLIDGIYDNKDKIPGMIGNGLKSVSNWVGSVFR